METSKEHTIRLVMSAMGKKGAAARVRATTPEQRTEWAKKAGRASQRKRRKLLRDNRKQGLTI